MDAKKFNKAVFYELNPRYYYDSAGTGIGNLHGLMQKFDYFKFLGVSGVILQDTLSTDSKNAGQSFQVPAVEIGELKDLTNLIDVAKKAKIGLFLELNIGSIKESNKWFERATSTMAGEMHDIIPFVAKAPTSHEADLEFIQSKRTNEFYPLNQLTREIPLNWKAPQVLEQFLEVIKLWHGRGISGFVLKNFEFINTDITAVVRNPMSDETISELHKLYRSIKNISPEIIVIGKSHVASPEEALKYTGGRDQIFDLFYSTEISTLGTKNGLIDIIGDFKTGELAARLNVINSGPQNLLAFGSSRVGRVVSRWGNDEQFHVQSAKTIAAVLLFSTASNVIYYGDEIGTKNIGLSHLDDFQDRSMELRKKNIVGAKYSEQAFMDAQLLQNPVNARSIMAWNASKNGGFSTADHTITTLSSSYHTVNVEAEFNDPNSVLHFYKKLIHLVTASPYAPLFATGEYKASSIIGGVIKIKITSEVAELAVYANFSAVEKSLLILSTAGTVILSSYGDKLYPSGVPRKLAAFETIVVVRKGQVYDLPAFNTKKGEATKPVATSKSAAPIRASDLARAEAELVEKQPPKSLAKTLETPVPTAEGETTKARRVKTGETKIIKTSETKTTKTKTSKIEIEKRRAVAEDQVLRGVAKGSEGPTTLLDSQVAKTTQVEVDDVKDIEAFLKELDKKKGKK